MVFDVLALQTRYGADATTAAGATTYTFSQSTPFMQTIWDAGGTDTIRYDGNLSATIDLRAATLVNGDPIAGGAVSRAAAIFGGFTIANGVVIENAVGGRGNDTLIGNSADNFLDGRAGDDSLDGGAGNDTAFFSAPGPPTR